MRVGDRGGFRDFVTGWATETVVAKDQRPSLVVLRFDNFGLPSEESYPADGLAGDLVTDL
jgi:TolB-like protein